MIIAGTEGYAEDADSLIERYESVSFAKKYESVLHLIPDRPGDVLDIGAGTGVDAAWLAAVGYRVVAVEPTDRLRQAAQALHPSPLIDWVADSLPGLRTLASRAQSFDLVLMSAVWAHLNQREHQEAMPNVAAMLRSDGVLLMSLRHGPAPANRRVFPVSAEATIQLAEREGLRSILNVEVGSILPINRQAGVTWTWLAFS
jgi:SAM-dependent methyltransferase